MHALILITVYLAVMVAPLILSALQGKAPRPFWDEVASGLAMVAFSILLVEFVLSGRFRVISRRLGMDVTMRFHQLVARTALVFALLHPFLYQLPIAGTLPWDPTRQATLALDGGALASGIVAWVALPGFVLISIFRDQLPYRYETWRMMHLLGAVLIAVMAAHHALDAGRYSSDPWLQGFWFLLLILALGSLAYGRLVAPLLRLRRRFTVTSVRKVAVKTWEVTVVPRGDASFGFEAGQFVWLRLGRGPFSLHENPFSISSAPARLPEIQFVIKEAGDSTRQIGALRPGTTAYLDGPHGNLTMAGRSGAGIALIAGGVGIAPLIGIARQLRAVGDPRPIVLLYGNRVAEQIVYHDELAELAAAPDTEVVHVLSEPPPGWSGLSGQIDRDTVRTAFSFDGASEWLYLLCGPPAMIDAVEDALAGLRVPGRRIVSERFYYD